MARRHHDPVVVRGVRPHRATGPGTDDRQVAWEGSGSAAAVLGGLHGPDLHDPEARDPDAHDPHDLVPRDFVWRGRRYTVCAVLASWQERRAWWREVGDDPSGPPSPQRRVWRVEARPPVGDAGVFDLGRDDDHWLLLRAHD
ncbi:DUF6504 family protein [Oryzobacter sp. R7]|uniref:DUF6504 family protein n=1 Tax=Oryzobacter faecalis TaxID=3388656 RepID=UPI00398D175B